MADFLVCLIHGLVGFVAAYTIARKPVLVAVLFLYAIYKIAQIPESGVYLSSLDMIGVLFALIGALFGLVKAVR